MSGFIGGWDLPTAKWTRAELNQFHILGGGRLDLRQTLPRPAGLDQHGHIQSDRGLHQPKASSKPKDGHVYETAAPATVGTEGIAIDNVSSPKPGSLGAAAFTAKTAENGLEITMGRRVVIKETFAIRQPGRMPVGSTCGHRPEYLYTVVQH